MSLIQMSASAAIMVLVVAAIRALAINRLPKKTFPALWGIVLLRLLVPFSVPSPLSFYSVISRAPLPVYIAAAPTGNFLTFTAAVENTPPAVLSAAPAIAVSPWVLVWGMGALLCSVYFAAAYYQCHRKFRNSLPVSNASAQGWLARHKIKRTIQIRSIRGISAPLTYGIFRPVILLPEGIDLTDTSRVQYILEHEYIHIRRFDAAAKMLLTAALCLHWFNPLVWWMYVLANRDIELSCDEAVVRSFGEAIKSAYALALINMEEKKSGLVPFSNSFSKNAIAERITAIMKIKKTSIVGVLLALVLIAGTTTVFATSAAGGGPKEHAAVTNEEEYTKWGVLKKDGAYYYNNERVRIFMDIRADRSFVTFRYDEEQGDIDVRLVRDTSGLIVKAEYIPEDEAAEIMRDLDVAQTNAADEFTEDIQRLTKEALPADILTAINDCTGETWYVVEGGGRQYIYYGNLPHNYAYQYEQGKHQVTVVDIGESTGNDVLLSVPQKPDLRIIYQSKTVAYTKKQASDAAPAGEYAEYSALGLTYNEASGRFYLNGELVRYFEDKALGRYFGAYEDGKKNVYAVRRGDGALISLEALNIETDRFDIIAREYGEVGLQIKGTASGGMELGGKPIRSFGDVAAGFGMTSKKVTDETEYEAVRNPADPGPVGVGRLVAVEPKVPDVDSQALDMMQRTGNWGYIEVYLPQMTNAGIDAVVNSYNSKHPNSSEHKKASDYYNE